MSMKIMRLLVVAFTLALMGASSTSATAPDHAKRNGCAVLFTQAEYRQYTKNVYLRSTISRKALTRIDKMRRCQHSYKAQVKARNFQRKQSRKRQVRLTAYCGTPRCNKNLGRVLASARGWGGRQFSCLNALWGTRESGWNQYADNPTSDAYGIPQALPGSKMGPGWQSNVRVQISWGLSYIAGRYGNPCSALGHSHSVGWY